MNGFVRVDVPNRATSYLYKYPKDYMFPRDAGDTPPTTSE